MNDYEGKFSYTSFRDIEVSKRKLTIRGYNVFDITREDIEIFCKARNIPPEWLVRSLLKSFINAQFRDEGEILCN